jgi:intracellular multiplication protein IcmP
MAEQQGGQGQESGLGPLWIIIALMVVVGVTWHYGHTYIVSFVFKVKLVEAQAVSFFTSDINSLIRLLQTADVGGVSFKELQNVSAAVGHYIAYPIAVTLGVLAIVLYMTNAPLQFRNRYTMQTLRDVESVNWPQITPIRKLDLVSIPLTQGPWAMVQTPMEFAKQYKLLKENPPDYAISGSFKNRGRTTVSVLRGEATRQFILQLGPYWRGPESLPLHIRALFAAFAARFNHDLAAGDALLANIALSTEKGKPDFSGTDELLKKYKDTKGIANLGEKHGFMLTAMATMLVKARADGVLASANFLWLKPIDRVLWFMLNNVGRQTAFVEVAGPVAHWKLELELGHRLYVPAVQEAVNGLETAIATVLYEPEEKASDDTKDKSKVA